MAIPIIPINDFCDNFSIECLNKIALIDNTCIFMGDLDINLLKSHANNVTSNFLEVMTSFFVFFCFFLCFFFAPDIQQFACVDGSFATLINNIFMNSVQFVTVLGKLLCQLAHHLLQFLLLKHFRAS